MRLTTALALLSLVLGALQVTHAQLLGARPTPLSGRVYVVSRDHFTKVSGLLRASGRPPDMAAMAPPQQDDFS